MPQYRVRSGARLPHAGQIFEEGALVDLPRRIAGEVRHLVDEVDVDGKPLTTAREAWEIALEDVRQHERISVLQLERQTAQSRLDDVTLLVDDMERRAAEGRQAVSRATAELARIDAAIADESSPAPAQAAVKKDSSSKKSALSASPAPAPAAAPKE